MLKRIVNYLRAFRLGVIDGWNQPYDLSSTANVEHLGKSEDHWMTQEWLDRGTIVGQFLRSPLHHQKIGE